MKKNIIFVVNPISGDLDKSELIESVNEFAVTHNFNLIVYETSGEQDLEEIKALYDQYQPSRIVVAGGDGTIKMVAEAMEEHDVIIGVLPAGSANGLSVDLNLPVTIEENLTIAFLHHYIEIDMICINGKKSIHLSDLGLNADLVKNYEESNLRGFWGYALQAYTTLKDAAEPFQATIVANNETVEHTARMIVVANSQKYGTGVIINPNGAMNDGQFELVILKSLDLLLLGRIITGNMPIDSDDIVIISTKQATIKTDNPVNFQIDGEYCGAQTNLEINILHKQMKIAVP
ncbi:diacylglycerol kinase family protein [Flavobacterium sp. Fl-77]|uniref:Diacylglycerol kinase family protein n=1 Tax=Flavobacterium flavipigmentatum TaxID=2893884 RepID=A0AAJ2SAW0_9FLAO|nr:MULTISPECIES: diacylglycerol kinase family protein [unclassified Flavobacterium]MDX6183179.1 diacylglycerol kinase family protein [Flavobacterium sp. Fl-33]MDX6186752.1 diacylglycerol kinase family protein [Flavobacterium sp. Fl-77]UFH40406.1 diacylglycerol kinase [Flavobacterium sp. F-70]